jgi:hypothetical protein
VDREVEVSPRSRAETEAPRDPELQELLASRRLQLRKKIGLAGGNWPGADREGSDEMKAHVAEGKVPAVSPKVEQGIAQFSLPSPSEADCPSTGETADT